jgi:hypothetical protein
VLVLGAGASKTYNFPIGVGLVDLICDRIISSDSDSMLNRLVSAGCDAGDVNDFAQNLRAARRYSIDRFLEMETRPDRVQIGKMAIADALLRAERQSTLGHAAEPDDWYRYLFDQLIRKTASYFESQAFRLSIVTFNFDRSFERALFLALRHNYRLDDGVAASLMTKLRIVHVHGVLGLPAWLDPTAADGVGYGGGSPDQWSRDLQVAAKLITLTHEDSHTTNILAARECFDDAERVAFLGFGYDEDNLKKLDVWASLESVDYVVGTSFGKGLAEVTAIRRIFGQKQIQLHNMGIRQFLAEVDLILD